MIGDGEITVLACGVVLTRHVPIADATGLTAGGRVGVAPIHHETGSPDTTDTAGGLQGT